MRVSQSVFCNYSDVSMAISPFMVAGLAIIFSVSGHCAPLHISTWGGSHAAVVNSQILKPFTRETGILIHRESEKSTALGPESVPDVLELDFHDAKIACDNGGLLLLPLSELPVDNIGSSLIEDYFPDSIQPCAVGHSVWSTVVAFNAEDYPDNSRPALISDFFNTDDFPGKRAIRKSPRVLAEWAIAASGVPLNGIYDSLEDAEFSWSLIKRKIDSIENEIVWADSDAQAIELLHSGQASFAMLGSDSVVRASIQDGTELGVIWDSAVSEFSMWAIPNGAADPHKSFEFLRFATSVVNSGKVASEFGYGPVRYSSLSQLDRTLQKLLPSSPANNANFILGNSRWWREHGDVLNQSFADWVAELGANRSLAFASAIEDITSRKSLLVKGKSYVDIHSMPQVISVPQQ